MRKAPKTILTAILLLSICISGCGKEKQEAVIQPVENSNVSEQVIEETEKNGATFYKATKEIKEAKPYDGYVQIKDKVVQLPASYEDLKKELEFKLITQDTLIQSEDFIVDGGDYLSIVVSLDDFGNQAEFYLRNLSEERATLKECQIQEITEFSPNSVFFPGGLTIGSSFDEVNAVLGEYYMEDESSSSLEYWYSVTITDKTIPFFKESMSNKLLEKIPCNEYVYNITFDRNTSTATDVNCTFQKEITQEYKDYVLGGQVSEYPIHCQMPYGMVDNDSLGQDGRFTGVLSVDEKQYLLILSNFNNDPYRGLGDIYDQYVEIRSEATQNDVSGQRYTIDEFSKFLLLPEDKKILTDTQTHITGISYSTNEDHIAAHLVHDMYIDNQIGNGLRDYVAFLYPVEGTEISENAVAEFKEIVEHIGTSMIMEPKE
ncbi:MAG: hypothetical protein ACLRSB_05990 [Blautia hansenii]